MNKTSLALQGTKGFTIVELLIVIVVIAILAAITIVAFNGISARAKYSAQVAAVDKIGKAIKLYSSEKGTSLAGSGAGWNGDGYGGFQTVAPAGSYTATSVETLLRNAGYLSGTIDNNAFNVSSVLLSPCHGLSDSRWVVYAIVTPAPEISVADQISETRCTTGYLSTYTGASYNRNLIRAY